MVSYIKKALTSTLIIYVFAIIGSFFAYLVRILFARNLSVAEYGLFFAVFGLLSLVFVFKDLGYGLTIIRFTPEFIVKKQMSYVKSSIVLTFIIQLVYSLIAAVIFFMLANYLSVNFFHDELAGNLIKLLVVWQILNSVISTLIVSFLGFQRFFLWAAINHLSMLAVFILTFIFFKMGFGYLTPALAYVFYALMFSIIFLPIFLKKVYPGFFKENLDFNKELLVKLTKFSIPQIFTNSSATIMSYIDTVMLTLMAGVAGVGIYHVAMPTSKLTLLLGEGLGTFLMPFVSELWTKKHVRHLIEGIHLIYKYVFIMIVPIVLLVFAFSDLIINLFFGIEYSGANMPLKILVLGMAAFTFFVINSAILLGINKPKVNAAILFAAMIFNVIANLILIYFFKVTGAAMATALSYGLLLCLSLYYIRKYIKIKIPFLYWIKVGAVGVFVVIIAYVLKWLININPYIETVFIVIIVSCVYLLILYVCKLLDIKEILEILNRFGLKDKIKNVLKAKAE